jgi:uncharacterized protein YegP (UPF0339 family)
MPGSSRSTRTRPANTRFRLKAANGEVAAVGEAYESQSGAHAGCTAVQRAADGAKIVDVDA